MLNVWVVKCTNEPVFISFKKHCKMQSTINKYVMFLTCCREKLKEDREFEVIGDISELQAQAASSNDTGPDAKSQGWLRYSFTLPCHCCINNYLRLETWLGGQLLAC